MLGVVNYLIGAEVDFHDTLRIFRVGREMGTSSLEVKLLQQLTEMREEVLYEVFIDLRNPTLPWTGSITWRFW